MLSSLSRAIPTRVLFRAQARASSWAVRKQLGLDGGIRARTKQSEEQPGEPVLVFAGLIDILQVRIVESGRRHLGRMSGANE